ncbi:MAG: DUF3306 domain-containing protein [Lysobacteraceae bacterium]
MATEPTREGEPLLRRLLRRRAGEEPAPAQEPAGATEAAVDAGAMEADAPATAPEAPASTTRIDARTGKPIDELVDADLPPIDSLGPDDDFSAFMGRRISPSLRRQAMRRLFANPRYNVVCLCAEYAEDYTNFTPLGDIVPHDMARQIAVNAERAARKLAESAGADDAAADSLAAAPDASADTGDRVQPTAVDDAGSAHQRPDQGLLQGSNPQASTKVEGPAGTDTDPAGKPRHG